MESNSSVFVIYTYSFYNYQVITIYIVKLVGILFSEDGIAEVTALVAEVFDSLTVSLTIDVIFDVDGMAGTDGIDIPVKDANAGFISPIILFTLTEPIGDELRPLNPNLGSGKAPRVSDFVDGIDDAADVTSEGAFTDGTDDFIVEDAVDVANSALGILGALTFGIDAVRLIFSVRLRVVQWPLLHQRDTPAGSCSSAQRFANL